MRRIRRRRRYPRHQRQGTSPEAIWEAPDAAGVGSRLRLMTQFRRRRFPPSRTVYPWGMETVRIGATPTDA